MTVSTSYDGQLSRVRVSVSSLTTDANAVRVERSTDQITWSTVRGGRAAALSSGSATVDDYEFAPNVVNYYRASPLQYDTFESTSRQVTVSSGDWSRTDITAGTGRWSYRSADIGNGGSSEVVVAVPADALTVRFGYRVSSESGFDFLRFLVDATEQLEVSGQGRWSESGTYDVSAAADVTWRYSKDSSVSVHLDAGFIDDVEFAFAAESTSITPTIDTVWIKNLARPYLNRTVTVTEFSDVTRPSRGGVFEVIGRTLPVAVTEQRTSRRYALTVMLPTVDDAEDFDASLIVGDPVLIQVPPDCLLPRSMYAVIGDTSMSRVMTYSPRRYFELPLTEVAAPDADVVGDTITWQGVIDAYATWSDVVADKATWADLLDTIADPGTVITQ